MKIKIRKFKNSDTEETALLISKTFARFNKREGSKKAVQGYIDFYDPRKNIDVIRKLFTRAEIFFVAIDKNKIVGMIRGKKNRIINLFVNGEYHNKGIGKRLLEKFEKECKKQGSLEIKISSSLYTVPFYQKFDYKKTTGIRKLKKLHGLNVQPMRKILFRL